MYKRVRDANEIKKRETLKFLLRKVVRQIIINKQWLEKEETDDDGKISSNVKKNIILVVRARTKTDLLTVNEKTLLRIPQSLRTVDERKKLCILMNNLDCFRTLSPILRSQLVPVLKLMMLDPGHKILTADDIPITLAFIVSGEVKFTEFSGNKKSKTQYTLGPGDCIGDIAMLEESPRNHSCITKSRCELLVLFENDFINILKPYMTKLWTDKKKAIRALNYFDFLNEEQRLIACKLSSLKQYQALDTIYQEEKGSLTSVHFVLSGECVILQCLNMKVIVKNGKKQYKLTDTVEARSNDANRDMFQTVSNIKDDHDDNDTVFNILGRKELETVCQSLQNKDISNNIASQSLADYSRYISELNEKISTPLEETEGVLSSSESSLFYHTATENVNMISFTNNLSNVGQQCNQSENESEVFTVSSSRCSNRCSDSLNSVTSQMTTCKYESHFIDVGSITFGGIMGLNEQSEQRVIMARNTVQCLLLPRFFLMEEDQNPGCIWQRRIFYLECMIPSRETLFEDFLQNIKWKKFKRDFLQKTIELNSLCTATEDDIPILCRIEAKVNN